MTRYSIAAAAAALALAAAPAFAASPPAQGTVQPHHATNPAPAHKMAAKGVEKPASPDHSADMLNAKELASLQHQSAMPAPAAPTKP